MQIYPFPSGVILNDAIFQAYGGQAYNSLPAQRSAAYWIAEQQATSYIGAPLLPTIVTGTFNYQGQPRIATDYGYVTNILAVNILSQDYQSTSCDLLSNAGCAFIWSDTYGYVDVQQLVPTISMVNYYNIPYPSFPPDMPYMANYLVPYQYQITYQCGLPTGVASQASILLALTIVAQIQVNLMSNQWALSGEADIGIDSWKSMDYSEMRHKSSIKRTAFGSSPWAMKAANLIDSAVVKARRQLQL